LTWSVLERLAAREEKRKRIALGPGVAELYEAELSHGIGKKSRLRKLNFGA